MPIGSGRGQSSLDYNVDLVMCIDATASMSPIIEEVKKNAKQFYKKFAEEMDRAEKSVQQFRIKVIVFRDYGCDSEPMVESKFFELDQEQEAFNEFVQNIEAIGGGDEPENSLEALALAMKSDWTEEGAVQRHIIMLYTDASALELGERKGSPLYPTDIPKSIGELREWWEGQYMNRRAQRLLLFAPDSNPWPSCSDWANTFHIASKAGAGCDDTDIDTCINLLVKSI